MKSRLPVLEKGDGRVAPVRTLLCQGGKTTNGSGHLPRDPDRDVTNPLH